MLVEQSWYAHTKLLSLALSHSGGAVNTSIVLEAANTAGVNQTDSLDSVVSEREKNQGPVGPHLHQNAPNPFDGTPVLQYHVKRRQPVKLAIYSLSGQ